MKLGALLYLFYDFFCMDLTHATQSFISINCLRSALNW